MVFKRRGFNKAVTTDFSSALESLNKKLKTAMESKDWDSVGIFSKYIDKLQLAIEKEKSLVESRSLVPTSLNLRNKEKNFKKDLQAGQRKKLLQQESGKPLLIDSDPFIRRETRPQKLWNTGMALKLEQQREDIRRELEQLKKTESGSEKIQKLEDDLRELDGVSKSRSKQISTNEKPIHANFEPVSTIDIQNLSFQKVHSFYE
jgi:hypothetical protein